MKLFLGWLVICSVAAFFLYGIDKSRARRRKWRIRESLLLGISFLGGAVGALCGMLLFRHKTRHWYFIFTALLGIAWQAAVLFFLFQ